MTTFAKFRSGPALDICKKVGFDIRELNTWGEYSSKFLRRNIESDGKLVNSLMNNSASSGEISVIQAILHAGDFSRQADELGGDATWLRLSYLFGDHAEAVAAVIARKN